MARFEVVVHVTLVVLRRRLPPKLDPLLPFGFTDVSRKRVAVRLKDVPRQLGKLAPPLPVYPLAAHRLRVLPLARLVGKVRFSVRLGSFCRVFSPLRVAVPLPADFFAKRGFCRRKVVFACLARLPLTVPPMRVVVHFA